LIQYNAENGRIQPCHRANRNILGLAATPLYKNGGVLPPKNQRRHPEGMLNAGATRCVYGGRKAKFIF
jgi:hypothetical protein